MISPHRLLKVMAVETANVHELNEHGMPFRTGAIRLVGKTYNPATNSYQVNPEGCQVLYHPHYVKCLKEQTLLAIDIETARACGVPLFSPSVAVQTTSNNKDQ
jgi:hypothetical protein